MQTHPGPTRPVVGELLKDWRGRRRLSQLDLASRAGVSTRHLSFVETGRSRPSRELVLHLAEHLSVPLRERNALLVAAGFAPVYPERPIDEPDLRAVREAIDRILAAHEPYPAIVVDRVWDLVAANRAAGLFIEGVDPSLLGPPLNALRVTLHPLGLQPRIDNLAEFAAHVLSGLARQVDATGDPGLLALYEELHGYTAAALGGDGVASHEPRPAVTLRLRRGDEMLSFVSMIATFGTAQDVTLSELAIETFLPADAETEAALRALA